MKDVEKMKKNENKAGMNSVLDAKIENIPYKDEELNKMTKDDSVDEASIEDCEGEG